MSPGAMCVVLIGPPGAGKGTQAKMLESCLGVQHISSGDLLREAVREGTEKGKEAKKYMDRGELVPDDLIVALIEERLGRGGEGFLLDGFPRNASQAETLAATLARLRRDVQHVVSIRVPTEEVVRRLSGRRTCRKCGALYHLRFNPPAQAGRCDVCGGELFQRDDDREDTIRARLEVFERETAPLLNYYRERSLLREVDGSGEPEAVMAAILNEIAG